MNTPKVHRIEIFALPFLVGTVAAMAFPHSLRIGTFLPSVTLFLLSLAVLQNLLIFKKYGAENIPSPLLFATPALCAAICVFRCEATSLSGGGASFIFGNISDCLYATCRKFQGVIDNIPMTDKENNALLKALLTGDRSGLSVQTANAFRDSGAAHILALSGLHLGIIYGIVVKAFAILGNSPKAVKSRSLLTIAATGVYCIMVGAGPSISRAFLFILLREFSVISGRSATLRDTLCGAFVIQICLNANAVHSVSFQLSYLAIAGIAYIYPLLHGIFPQAGMKHSPIRWIWNSVALSMACQLTTSPAAWFYFNTFPKYFILTNLISLPLTGILLPSSLLTALLSALGICPSMLVRATEFLATTLRQSLEIIAGM